RTLFLSLFYPVVCSSFHFPSSSFLYQFSSPCFFSTATPTSDIYTLSLHDALPICHLRLSPRQDQISSPDAKAAAGRYFVELESGDRKSTRLNSSHLVISYAVFCLKKKK